MQTFKDLFHVMPKAYQDRGIKYGLTHHYFILGDDMGLGKTLQALGVAMASKSKRVLVVCPSYLRENWISEIEKLCATWIDAEAIRSAKDLERVERDEVDFIIVSYHFVCQSEELFHWADMVIADECQMLKDMNTNWTMCFHKFLYEGQPERFVACSGTPIENCVAEWFSILMLMSYSPKKTNGESVKDLFKSDYYRFARYFCWVEYVKIRGGRTIEKYHGIKNRGRLGQLLKGKYIRRLSKDQLDLPKLLRKNVTVNYRDDGELLQTWYDHVSTETSVESRAKTRSAVVKAPFTAEYCRALSEERGKPILVFTDHRESCEKIAKKLGWPEVNGSVSEAERERITKAFQAGEIGGIVATIKSLYTGKTLTAAQDVVFNDKNWNPMVNKQAIFRIYRIGQESTCMVHNIIGSPQDLYINNKLEEKEEAVNQGL